MRGRTTHQLSFGDGFIDPSLFRLDEELTTVDRLLSNPEFLKPFEAVFDSTMGRPGTDVGVYLRMMYLKFRWGLSYQEVETEVRERLTWRRFCHLSLMDPVPDSTTLIKLNQRFGDTLVAQLNKTLVKHLLKTKSIKPRKIRIDSTTLESHITYPTDLGLLHQTVKTLTRCATSLGQKISNHVRATKKAVAQLGMSLKSKSKQQKAQIHKTLRQVATLAQDTVHQSRQALKSLKKKKTAVSANAQQQFEQQIAVAEQILEQTQQKLDGVKSIPDRIVSFYDPEARVICKGKLHKPNEFGRTLQIVQDASGVLLDVEIHEGNSSDKTFILPMVKRIKKLLGRAPVDLTADKGYYTPGNIADLQHLAVKRVSIAKVGRLNPHEYRRQQSKWFKGLQRFRCGIEAGISMLKRCFLLDRILSPGNTGTRIWVGFSIFSYNLWQLA